MSTGIRKRARIDRSPTEITATKTVRGRRSAIRINHISLASCGMLARQHQKWLKIALRQCFAEHGSPDCQSCEFVVDLGLQEKSLGLRNIYDGRQCGFISSVRLCFSQSCGLQFDWRILTN